MRKTFNLRMALLMAVLVIGTGLFSTGCGSDLNPEEGWQVCDALDYGTAQTVKVDPEMLPSGITDDLERFQSSSVIITSQAELDDFIAGNRPEIDGQFDAPVIDAASRPIDFSNKAMIISYSGAKYVPGRVTHTLIYKNNEQKYLLQLIYGSSDKSTTMDDDAYYLVRSIAIANLEHETNNWEIERYYDVPLQRK